MKIAVTQGDPAGIGPEVLLKALARLEVPGSLEVEVLGQPEVLGPLARRLGLPPPARLRPVGGAFLALEEAARGAARGEFAAVVTAPVHKARLRAEGFPFPGQTEFFADRLAAPDFAMMLARGGLRVVPLSTHIALAAVPEAVREEEVLRRARTIHRSLVRDFGVAEPRIAVLGLNPHAGEDGLFGDEEILRIAPAVAALRAEGIRAEGPLPADAVFTRRRRDGFDAILGMYHDQVLGPFKALADGRGVNVTIGLPVVRTSPDHGTADDIAGRDLADEGSMLEALELAVAVARRRGPG